jgi:hypothetical protein
MNNDKQLSQVLKWYGDCLEENTHLRKRLLEADSAASALAGIIAELGTPEMKHEAKAAIKFLMMLNAHPFEKQAPDDDA